MGINKPKDWPENLYDKKMQQEQKSGGSFISTWLKTIGVDLGAMRIGFKVTVDERDKQILKYLDKKGVLPDLMKE